MKATDKNVRQLIKLLKKNPDLISALVLDPDRIQKLLKTESARRIALGVDVEAFLRKLAKPPEGGPIAQCLHATAYLCAGGTAHVLGHCIGGTRPTGPRAEARRASASKRTRKSS